MAAELEQTLAVGELIMKLQELGPELLDKPVVIVPDRSGGEHWLEEVGLAEEVGDEITVGDSIEAVRVHIVATGDPDERVLQPSNADEFVAERLSCVLRPPNRKGCR